MTNLLFPHSFIGFDALLNDIEKLSQTPNYPPHSITESVDKEGNSKYKISIAVAGFRKENIEVTHQNSYVFIKGEKESQKSTDKVIFSNFSQRNFHLKFKISENVTVDNVKLDNGVLAIELVGKPEQQIKRFSIE